MSQQTLNVDSTVQAAETVTAWMRSQGGFYIRKRGKRRPCLAILTGFTLPDLTMTHLSIIINENFRMVKSTKRGTKELTRPPHKLLSWLMRYPAGLRVVTDDIVSLLR